MALYLQFLDDEPPIANRLDLHFAHLNATILNSFGAFTGSKKTVALGEAGLLFPITEKDRESDEPDSRPMYLQFQEFMSQ